MFEQRIQLPQHLTRIHLDDGNAPAAQNEDAQRAGNDAELRAVRALFESVLEAIETLHQERRQSLDELQHVAVELAAAIASHLVCEKLDSGEFAASDMVERVLAQFAVDTPVTVRIHPDMLSLVNRETKETPEQRSRQIQFVADQSLAVGDCCVESDSRSLFAGIDLQLEELRLHLSRNLDHAQTERRQTQTDDRSLRRFPDRRETA